jgi:hypothetical protein
MVEYKISLTFFKLMWNKINYIVLILSKCIKQPVTNSKLMSGSSKLELNKRIISKLGIPRLEKIIEVRKTHSNIIIFGKESNYRNVSTFKFENFKIYKQLKKLKVNSEGKFTNLNNIISKPEFLINSWNNIQHKKNNDNINNKTLKIDSKWLIKTSNSLKNNQFCFKPFYITNNNKEVIIIPSLKDKIVQEGIKYLLNHIFKLELGFNSNTFYKFKNLNEYCHNNTINDIKLIYKNSDYYIQSEINFRILSKKNNDIILNKIKEKIDDQLFINLLYKYLIIGYEKNNKLKFSFIKKEDNLSSLLFYIYIHSFDKWINNNNKTLLPKFNFNNSKNKSTLIYDFNIKKIYYFRNSYNFIILIYGTKKDCTKLIEKIKKFLKSNLELTLDFNKTKIINTKKSYLNFFGFEFYKTRYKKIMGKKIMYYCRTEINAPIYKIIQKLSNKGYLKKNRPTKNDKLINLNLYCIVKHYIDLEKKIFNYYSIVDNYKKLLLKIHYILKYSCILTIASKMRLTTARKVFHKYGKNICIKEKNKSISYTYPSLKKKYDKKFICFYSNNNFI